jgi:hypothetical protein
MHENLFYYRTLNKLILFELNLSTMLLSMIQQQVKSLKLTTDGQQTTRIVVLMSNDCSTFLSPVSGACLAHVPNMAQKPIKQVLHDMTRYENIRILSASLLHISIPSMEISMFIVKNTKHMISFSRVNSLF